MYVAPLQVDMLLGIDSLQDNGVLHHCSTGDFRVGGSICGQGEILGAGSFGASCGDTLFLGVGD